jgi:hypothetical protein
MEVLPRQMLEYWKCMMVCNTSTTWQGKGVVNCTRDVSRR